MPKALPINPDLVRALFGYNPETGALIPKPTAQRAARRVNSKQWEFGVGTYSMHRIIWAYHNPTNPNPRYIGFVDRDPRNTRIENLVAKATHPRWEGHTKKINAEFDEYGRITVPSKYIEASTGALVPVHLLATMTKDDMVRLGIDPEKYQ